ncbi:3-isopropylmalate dehydratase large subunit [Candidatus Woesearchaeota archaeon]|nr:3-isopropylmalate dehydratase large subunit [Candidatus Woesearchaeota archaeon]
MDMTITEKILAKHSGKEKVIPGEIINADIDVIMCHDVTTTPAIDLIESNQMKVKYPERVVVMPDHFVPNKDIKSAEMVKKIRDWAKTNKITFYELGTHGVCHALLPEQGYVKPGETIICGDSHTCTHGAFGAFSTGIGSTDLAAALGTGKLWFKVPPTIKFNINGTLRAHVYAKDVILHILSLIGVDGAMYAAMEFSGDTIRSMSMESRMTLCNMAIEAGGKSGIIEPDEITLSYLKAHNKESDKNKSFDYLKSDQGARYLKVYDINASDIIPIVSVPSLPSNAKKASELNNIKIDQAYIGSCTNGRLEDLQIAARFLKNKKIAKGVRLIVVPATTEIWKQANKEGLLDIFMEAGGTVSTPTCGACLGGHMGILAKGERCISTTNRNFVGRMGHPESEVYLASPATAAASAVTGRITCPQLTNGDQHE